MSIRPKQAMLLCHRERWARGARTQGVLVGTGHRGTSPGASLCPVNAFPFHFRARLETREKAATIMRSLAVMLAQAVAERGPQAEGRRPGRWAEQEHLRADLRSRNETLREAKLPAATLDGEADGR